MSETINKKALLDWLESLPHHSGKAHIMNEICSKRFDSVSDKAITELEANQYVIIK